MLFSQTKNSLGARWGLPKSVVGVALIFSIVFSLLPHSALALASPQIDSGPSSSTNQGTSAPYGGWTLEQQIQSVSYWYALSGCIGGHMRDQIGGYTPSTIDAGDPSKWFDTGDKIAHVYPDGDVSCETAMNGALRLWGYQGGSVVLRQMNYSEDKDAGKYIFQGDNCTGTCGFSRARREAFQNAVRNHVFNATSFQGDPSLSDPAKYVLYLKGFTDPSPCQAQRIGLYSDLKPAEQSAVDNHQTIDASQVNIKTPGTFFAPTTGVAKYDKVSMVDENNKVQDYGYVYLISTSSTIATGEGAATTITDPTTAHLYGYNQKSDFTSDNGVSKTCEELVQGLNDTVKAYTKYVLQTGIAPVTPVNHQGGGGDSASNCQIQELGWILCPVLTVGAKIADGSYGFLANNFLQVRSSLVNTDPNAKDAQGNLEGTGTYKAWGVMRDFANVGLVIAFIIIIFSQLTSIGINNYGIKKMLPRLIVAAVMINVSFFICQIAVDLSNMLGFGLRGIMAAAAGKVMTAGGTVELTNDSNLAGIVLTIIAAATIAWMSVGALIVAVAGAVVILATVFVLLALRQVLIVLLVAIAPLAFVAYLLPNTQSLFDRWRKTLMALLMLFPILGLLYGAGILAHAILLQASGGDVVLRIFAYIALIAPLIAAIPLLRGSLNAVGSLAGAVNKMGSWGKGLATKRAQQSYDRSRLGQYKKYRESESAKRRALVQAGVYKGRGGNFNPRNLMSTMNSKLNANSGKFGQRIEASGVSLSEKTEAEDVEMALKALERGAVASKNENYVKDEFESALKKGDSARARAAFTALLNQGEGGVEKARKVIADNPGLSPTVTESLRNYVLTKHSDIKARDNRLMDWASKGTGADGAEHLAGLTNAQIATQTGASLLAGLSAMDAKDSQTLASRVLADTTVQKDIKPNQRRMLENARAGLPIDAASAITEASNGNGGATTSQPQPTSPAPIPNAADENRRRQQEQVQRVMEESGEAEVWSRWREQQQGGTHVDNQNRQTPNGASDDYHDKMNH